MGHIPAIKHFVAVVVSYHIINHPTYREHCTGATCMLFILILVFQTDSNRSLKGDSLK